MTTPVNQQPATIRAWLNEHGVADVAPHHIARALGVKRSEVEFLLSGAPTAEALLNLNRLAQYRHLALANRVWPHCTWLDWQGRQIERHPVIDLIRRVFGGDLLDYVSRTFGRELVHKYWLDLSVPDEYDDIVLDYEASDPFEDVPDEQMVDNPHFDPEEDGGELFVFGHAATAACFRWLIESRSNYSHFVDNLTTYTHDPMGIQLAYNLRCELKEEYWATLPPDMLPVYLAMVRSLQLATVPDEYHAGRLAPLQVVQAATLLTDRLEVVQTDDKQVRLSGADALVFEHEPVHVFVVEPVTDETPAAVILTTRTEPGNPEQHRSNPPYRFLHRSHDTMQLAFVPRDQVVYVRQNFNDVEEILFETLVDADCQIDSATGIFCIWRFNPSYIAGWGEPIPVYRIPGGYMLQFNPEYSFSPQEMAVE